MEEPRDENERQYRVVDQMITMHSLYRDRMERRAFWLNTVLIALSLFLTVFTFVGDDLIRQFGFEPGMTRFIFGIVTVFILIASITEFRVDWRSVSGRHAEAVKRLVLLKEKFREAYLNSACSLPAQNALLTTEYNNVMHGLPAIPDRYFNELKAEHEFKVLLSRRISQYPKTPIWFLRLLLWIEGIREAWKKDNK